MHPPLRHMVIKGKEEAITLIIVNSFIRFWKEIQNSLGVFVKSMVSATLNHMSGICFGLAAVAKLICTKVWMSFKELIIFHFHTKSPEKIDFALITLECKKNLGKIILTLYPTHISSRMNMATWWVIIRN